MNRVDTRTTNSKSEAEIQKSNNRIIGFMGAVIVGLTIPITLLAIRNSEATNITADDIQDVADCAFESAPSLGDPVESSVQTCESQLGVDLKDQFGYTVQIVEAMQSDHTEQP